MKKLNLGCGNDIIQGWENIDVVYSNFLESPSWTVGMDILDYLRDVAPTNTFDEVKAHHILEHVADLDEVMKQLHRACVKGAIIDIVVPLANTLWAVANPDHKRLFNHRTFQYYTKDFVTSDIGLFRGYEIVSQKIEREPDEWFDGIQWIVANLHTKLKVVK